MKCIVELSGLSEMSKSLYIRQSQGYSEQDDFLEEIDPGTLMVRDFVTNLNFNLPVSFIV